MSRRLELRRTEPPRPLLVDRAQPRRVRLDQALLEIAALDRLDHALVVGTLAGDDTLLVIARDSAGAEALARELG